MRSHLPSAFALIFAAITLQSCAQLHHVQVADMDFTQGQVKPFELMVSETGINTEEIARTASALSGSRGAGRTIRNAEAILSLFQYGPVTGNKVFTSDAYADELAERIFEKCPTANVTGLVSIRESRKYPWISGEIVKIQGYCIL